MATPQELAQILIHYWQSAALSSVEYARLLKGGTIANIIDHAKALAQAQVAMKQLVAAAVSDPRVRLSAFAGNGIFEQALLLEDGRLTGVILNEVRAGMADLVARTVLFAAGQMDFVGRTILFAGDTQLRSPRQIMLDGIYDAGTAGVFSVKDPSGLTSWLKSVMAAEIAITAAGKGDPDPGVRAALLRILRDCALPEALARGLKNGRLFEAINELLVTAALPTAARGAIKALSVEADARVTRDLAKLPELGELPGFPTGDGAIAPTMPASLAWYRRPGWIAAIGIGTAIGGALGAGARGAR